MISSLFLGALAAATAAPVSPAPLVVEHCDFGEKNQFETVECRFQLRNVGKHPIKISNIRSSSAEDSVSPTKLVVPANSTGEVEFTTRTVDRIGQFVRFVSFDVEGESRRLIASGFVVSDLDDARQGIDFGTVNALEGSKFQSITLSSRAIADFRIVRVIDAPAWVDVRLEPDHRTLSARVKKGAPWVPGEGKIKLEVNTPRQSEAWVTVAANLQGAVIPSSNPYEIGPINQGGTHEFSVRLNSRDRKPLKLGKISAVGPQVGVSTQPCVPATVDCVQLRAVLPDSLPLGLFRGAIVVELPDFDRELPITFGGLLVARTTEIRRVPPDATGTRGEGAGSGDGGEPPSAVQPDLSGALRNSVLQAQTQAVTAPPPGRGPLLRWQVANEQQVHGYLIHRADSENGPFVRVNKETIRVASDGAGWNYQWRDETAEPGKTYWYHVSVINKSGKIEPLSNPQRMVAK